MAFKMKYEITPMYLTKPSKRRPGIKMNKVLFVVAHDTGNKNSTAKGNISYYERSRNEVEASAHIFVDDTGIYECIPALTGTPEKAWHVRYDVPLDNKLYGDDANDVAIGVEYCYGDNINADEAYKRYVWVMAYICYKFKLNPSKSIIGHMILDPQRKTDPANGLKYSGRTYEQLLKDVVKEYNDCLKSENLNKEVVKKVMKTFSKYFKDVDKEWMAKHIDSLYEKKIVSGRGDGIYDPNTPITRGEAAVLVNSAIDYVLEEVRKEMCK